ncbi:hypothetical protein [Paucimonas lemoignei]|uniref:hypothetical protein n=1 Tax=Paucimonas lemoignei TaxID=29443 RepID=UPI001FB336C3|nr:hypothetical protein [Paucimonas lemoignei]
MLIVAIAWIYVVLLMSLTEHSVIAGIMTFLLYCVLPLTTVLYLMATPQRRRRNKEPANRTAVTQPDGSERSIIASADSSIAVSPEPASGDRTDASPGPKTGELQ